MGRAFCFFINNLNIYHMSATNSKLSPPRFNRYSRKSYAAFQSLGREVCIGVLSVAMLSTQQVTARTVQDTQAVRDTTIHDEASLDELTVTSAPSPLAMLAQSRMVTVITRDEIARAAVPSVNDLLKSVAGVDVRQRGGFSMQTDISIDGGTFDQLTILLNGTNITNPHTGHLTMDLPVNVSDIERIEILEGAASRVCGAGAFGGAVNIVTRAVANDAPRHEFRASVYGGSWGTVGGEAQWCAPTGRSAHLLSAGAMRSDGGTANSDCRRLNAYYNGSAGTFRWQLGAADKRYGANTFYSPKFPEQWEENRRYVASLATDIRLSKAQSKTRVVLLPSAYWVHTDDHFQLVRGTATGENFHRVDVIGGALTADIAWSIGKTSLGVNVRHERIASTNLGAPRETTSKYDHADQRTLGDLRLDHSLTLGRWSLSAGVVASAATAFGGVRFYPGIDIAYRPDSHWRLYASYNSGFRLPTFTDLYYSGAERQGNGSLSPEETHQLSLGTAFRTSWAEASVRLFYHRGSHMIDWVKYSAADPVYYAADFDLHNLGVQVAASADLARAFGLPQTLLRLSCAYTHIRQWRRDAREVYKSSYAGEYLRHKFTARFAHTIYRGLSAEWSLRVCDRTGSYELYENHQPTGTLHAYTPYSLIDTKIQWQTRHLTVSLTAENITNRRYYDLGNIPQPGTCLLAAIAWTL